MAYLYWTKEDILVLRKHHLVTLAEVPHSTAALQQLSGNINVRSNVIAGNPPLVIRRLGTIRKCYGCKKAFFKRTRNPPHGLTFTMQAYRDDIPDGHRGLIVPRHASPIYI